MHAGFQTAIRLIYPPRCLSCGEIVESDFGLCGPCWRETPFAGGLVCDLCGVGLPGEAGGEAVQCDDCMIVARPWVQGRAALHYTGTGRKLVLALKHGDRHDIVRPAARWMARAVRPILRRDTLIVPVPLHRRRLAARRFNQSALLAQALAQELGHAHCPDLLVRRHETRKLDGMDRGTRFAEVAQSMALHPRRAHDVAARPVLLVDDVMTTGATLAAAAEVLRASRAGEICVAVLARVGRDD